MGVNLKGPDGRDCSVRIRNKIVKLAGHRTSTLYFTNPDQREVEQIEVDGCAITEGLRCDWMLRTNDHVSCDDIFVELKGSDIEHAIRQLEASISQLSPSRASVSRRCYVAVTRCPLAGTDITKYQLHFKKHHNARFKPVRDGGEIPL